MPASRAVTNASPLGPRASRSVARTSGCNRTVAIARASRAVTGLLEMSTIRGAPSASRWLGRDLPYRQRLPGLDRDSPEVQAPGVLEDATHVVVLADADATRGDD